MSWFNQLLPYNYGKAAGDTTQGGAPTGAPQMTGPGGGPQGGAYQPNQPTTQLAQPPKQPSQSGASAPQPQQTFAQMQAAGQARPPMPAPTQAPNIAPQGQQPAIPDSSGIFAGDPTRPGSGYINYNGQPYRIEGTTAAGLDAKGNPNSMAGAKYYLDSGNGNYITGPDVNQNDYNAWVNAYHGPNTTAPGATPGGAPMDGASGSQTGMQIAQLLGNQPTTSASSAPNTNTTYNPMMLAGGPTGPAATAPSGGQGTTPDILSMLTGGATGNGAGSGVQNATQQAALNQLNNPSPYGSNDVRSLYNWEAGNIDDQYALQRQAVGDQMARRGLGTSTIHAGNLNNLNIGQRSALAQLGENLNQNYAQTLGQYQANAINQGNQVGTSAQNNQQNWLSQLMGYGQQGFNNDLATNAQNQNATNNYQNYILSLLGMGYQP